MLYTLSQALAKTDIQTLFSLVTPNDVILLFQDAVTSAIKQGYYLDKLLATHAKIYALQADLEARGLLPFLDSAVLLADYKTFVQLTIDHTPQIAW